MRISLFPALIGSIAFAASDAWCQIAEVPGRDLLTFPIALVAEAPALPGMFSGKIQQALGYQHFYLIVCLATIPGFIVIPFIPKESRPKEAAHG